MDFSEQFCFIEKHVESVEGSRVRSLSRVPSFSRLQLARACAKGTNAGSVRIHCRQHDARSLHRGHSWCQTPCGLSQMRNDTCSPPRYQSGCSTALQFSCAPPEDPSRIPGYRWSFDLQYTVNVFSCHEVFLESELYKRCFNFIFSSG